MNKIRLAFTAAIISVAVPAFAQGIYLDLGADGPRRYRDDGRRDRDYDRPRYRERDRYDDRGGRGNGGGGFYRPNTARFKTFNGCQNGYTVQDGLCKPYRGY